MFDKAYNGNDSPDPFKNHKRNRIDQDASVTGHNAANNVQRIIQIGFLPDEPEGGKEKSCKNAGDANATDKIGVSHFVFSFALRKYAFAGYKILPVYILRKST
jgi:hypothetical protein